MPPPTETALLSDLQTSDDSNHVHSLVADYLRPISTLLNSKKASKKSDQTTVRSLAKQFLSFLSKSFPIIYNRLFIQNPNQQQRTSLSLFFDTYRLCIACIEFVSSQLAGGPHLVQIQRLKLVYCLQAWGRYDEGESEAFRVLERLRGGVNPGGKLVPSIDVGGGDSKFGSIVVDAVASVVKSVAMGQSKDCGKYEKGLALLEQVRPWFRVLEVVVFEKSHNMLVAYLGRCCRFLVEEINNFGEDLVRRFIVECLAEYTRSTMKDQVYKFARRICSSLFSLEGSRSSVSIDLVTLVLASVSRECKVELENNATEFIELVDYCANKCRSASTVFCSTLARHLNNMAGDFPKATVPVDLILRLYATGLVFAEHNVKSKPDDFTTSKGVEDDSAIKVLFLERDKLHNMSALLGSLGNFFSIGKQETCISSDIKYKTSMICKDRKACLVMYYNTLKFLCQPLAELVNSEKKRILAEADASSDSSKLSFIQDAFYQFCDSFFSLESCTSETEREEFDDDEVLIPSVIVAGFILSICTKLKMQEGACYIKQIICSGWIQSQGLKYLFVSLYNIGVLMYRSKQMKEALKALKLSYRASWTNIQLLSEKFAHKKSSDDHLSEDAIRDLITDACTRSAFLLEVLNACGNLKVKRIIFESLENWAMAEKLFRQLPGPMPLIKQWIKIQCKLHKNVGVEDSASTLGCMLFSSTKVSKRAIGIILEQELLAYQEMNHGYPDLCQGMQIKVIDLLMQDVYTTEGSPLWKARILIRKGRALRANGIEALKDCIQCLSEAISIMENLYGQRNTPGTSAHHQLAAAYCLRALCAQEAEPSSEQVYQDICIALDLWLGIFVPDSCFADEEFKMVSGNTLPLLYNILDLLSMKGYTKLHSNLYKLIIRIYELNNLQLVKCLANLWECRRLSHALCVSPVNESFITNLSEHCGESSKSIDFWINCLSGSQPGLLGFQQNLTCFSNTFSDGLKNHERDVQSVFTVDNVKQIACELTASDPVRSHSLFLAGHLYYDLCERHISIAQLFKGLSYAKEAFRLRSQLFKRKFTFSIEEQVEKYNETGDIGEIAQKVTNGPKKLQVHKIVASDLWSFDGSSENLCDYYLSPWNVLQCYLESILQVGCVNEMTGNGIEAESFLLWGKSISCSQGLPLFEAAFSSVLGKLYRKKRLWNYAEKELQSAKKVLVDGDSYNSCIRCRLLLEVNLEQQLGDLFRNLFDSIIINRSKDELSHAEFLYKSALEKLNHSEWNNITCDEENNENLINRTTITSTEDVTGNAAAHHTRNQPEVIGARKSRKTKNVSKSVQKEQHVITERSSRVTRSKSRSSQNQSMSSAGESQGGHLKQLNGEVGSKLSVTCWEKESSFLGNRSCMDESRNEIACICNGTKCWHCLPTEISKSGLLKFFINMKWECARRRLLVRVLTGIGKCLEYHGQTHEIHKVVWQSICAIVCRNKCTQTCSRAHATFLLDLIGREILGDAFAVERAAILYHIGWITVKNFYSKDTRIVCCDLSNVQLSKIVHWLKLAFVLCREVPVLFQKVSRLLCAIYLLSATHEHFVLPFCKALSESHWASYFHQASLGTQLNYQFFPNTYGRSNAPRFVDTGDLHAIGSSCLHTETSSLLRLAPESVSDLEQFVVNFYAGLPCTAIICISLLGRAYTSLLKELLLYPSSIHAWMLLSRLNSKNQPIVLLLPLDSVLEEVLEAAPDDDARACQELHQWMNSGKKWNCPWGSTVVDDVAPAYKVILEENFITSASCPPDDTKSARSLWWMMRKKVDHQLGELLSDLEDSWLGPWRHVLLGDCLDCKSLNTVHKKLVRDLKSKCKMDINESFLKLVLGGGEFINEETCLSQQCLRKGCYIGMLKHHSEESCRSNATDNVSALASQLIREAVNELHVEDTIPREPIILVLDHDVQMLPWESIPILRQQEVYRMPSVGSISMTLERSSRYQDEMGSNAAAFPLIDPFDAFYLLNPGGDLPNTQAQFENWFRDQNFEGKAGTEPTAEELVTALKTHDLFLYFGHGSGEQYVSREDIQGLEKCAATLLMGCSSGSLKLNGCYVPRGISLSYIQAGSPVIIANLWEVTDKDIDRFGKAVLDAWFRERTDLADCCSQCNVLIEEFEAMKIRGGRKGNSKKKMTSSSNAGEATSGGSSSKNVCEHRPKIGSFVGRAREACTLRFLNGASPVCYGVPTGIRRKNKNL